MDAAARIVIRPGPERTALHIAASAPPFGIRRCGGRVLVAASAAGPVGGDRLRLDACILPGARADIGSVGAMSVHPGPTGQPSTLHSTLSIGAGAHLEWWPEPTVSIVGSDHAATTVVELADDATCRVVDEVSLGRTGEPSGRLRLALHVTRAGLPLVRHAETFGPAVPATSSAFVPGAGSLVSVGAARHVLSAVVVGGVVGQCVGTSRTIVTDTCRAGWLPMAPDVAVLLAVGCDRPTVLRVVADLVPGFTG